MRFRVRCEAAALAALVVCALATGANAAEWELRVCADPDNPPFSTRDGGGFDNRIAELLAEEMAAELVYVWLPSTRGAVRQHYVQTGACDIVMGVIDGQRGFLTSHAYYRTGYVFLYPEGAGYEIASLDDAKLHRLRIGVPGGARKIVPPAVALTRRGIVDNVVHFVDRRTAGTAYDPAAAAVADGRVDVSVVWGPMAGELAREQPGLVIAPVRPEIDLPFIPMVASFAVGVRPGDEALRDDIDRAIARSWDRTRAILAEASVPLLSLPRPVAAVERAE